MIYSRFISITWTDQSFWHIHFRFFVGIGQLPRITIRRSLDKFFRQCIRWVGINYFAGKWSSRNGVDYEGEKKRGIKLKEVKRAKRIPRIQHRLVARDRNRRSRSGRRWSVKHRPILPALPVSVYVPTIVSRSAKSCTVVWSSYCRIRFFTEEQVKLFREMCGTNQIPITLRWNAFSVALPFTKYNGMEQTNLNFLLITYQLIRYDIRKTK